MFDVICLPGAQARRQQPPPLKFMALQPLTPLHIPSHVSGPVTPFHGPWQPTFGQSLSPYVTSIGPYQPFGTMSRTTTVPAAAAAKSSSSANNGIAAAAVPRRATESTRARSNEGTARGSRLRHAISPDFHHAILTATDRLFTVPKVNRMNDEDQVVIRPTVLGTTPVPVLPVLVPLQVVCHAVGQSAFVLLPRSAQVC